MKKTIKENPIFMQSGVSLEAEPFFRAEFGKDRNLPRELNFLNELSRNFYWSWNEDCVRLFQDIDPAVWAECEQNPRYFLDRVKSIRLWEKAGDKDYLTRLGIVETKLAGYLNTPGESFGPINKEKPIAYFCAEYGVHNSLPIYSGGLGILAGDHLKSASDLGVPLVAVGLLYRFGYFRQTVQHDGWQKERYVDSFGHELALEPVHDGEGNRITVTINVRDRVVKACAWRARVGRVSLYLMDTNVEENDVIDRYITGHLYGGDTETRIVQEMVLGIGGLRLLRKLNIDPSVFHLNEGHSAFLTLELIREGRLNAPELSFVDVLPRVISQCVFTTHTPVAAGNDEFDPVLIEAAFAESFVDSLGLSMSELLDLGRTDPENGEEYFGMTPLAIRMCRSTNGVSAKHGEVSRALWQKMFPDETAVEAVPITSITNGAHPPTWIGPVLKDIYEQYIGSDWQLTLRQPELWSNAVKAIPDAAIWSAHRVAKNHLISFIRERTQRQDTGRKHTIHEHRVTEDLLDPNVLTIGFARRIAGYKRWNLLMTDVDRLLGMVDDPETPVQFVFAGKAHPQDRKAKKILQDLMLINHDSTWQRRAVFIEDYDQDIARYLVRGVDVWMNVPRRPLEASGTSGIKVAMNGGLNFSVLDGWWIEGYNKNNGFAIGPPEDPEYLNQDELDLNDANSLYEVLEDQIIPRYYDIGESGLPEKWIASMKDSLITLSQSFSSDRMVMDYVNQIYKQN
jgi:starch phosphorylase